MSPRPNALNGMRHIAFTVENLEEVERFYVELLGMQVLHRPHANLVYLTLGNDNLSLSRGSATDSPRGPQRLDHFGFICDEPGDVDAWADYLARQGVEILARPHDHSNDPGVRSFYCLDPAGNTVQPIYHPAVSGQRLVKP
jgi:catechol 2,3-dioxygenase-like lactoylglutathione lyase family enzyme